MIAPLLFSIMLYDINKIQKHDAIITLYDDDLVIWKESKCRKFTNITKTKIVFVTDPKALPRNYKYS